MDVTRVATFNVQHGRRPDGVVDVAMVGAVCSSLDVEVLGLQEVDVGSARTGGADLAAEVATACGLSVVFGPALTLRGGGAYGNALLARGTIDDVEVLQLPVRNAAEPRAAVLARAAGASVAVCHLGLRGEGGDQLPVLLDALRDRPGPRLLLGDLNLDAEVVRPLAEAAGFSMVGAPPTWPAHRPRRTIDHVLLDGFVAAAVEVAHLPVSDHRALVVEVEVRSP